MAVEKVFSVFTFMLTHILLNLNPSRRIIEKNNGEPPLTYRKFQLVLKSLGQPQKPAGCLTAEHFKRCSTPLAHNKDIYSIPSLAELGITPNAGELAESKYPGGECVALERMKTCFEDDVKILPF